MAQVLVPTRRVPGLMGEHLHSLGSGGLVRRLPDYLWFSLGCGGLRQLLREVLRALTPVRTPAAVQNVAPHVLGAPERRRINPFSEGGLARPHPHRFQDSHTEEQADQAWPAIGDER